MRKVKFLLLAALTVMFVGCQSDEVLEQDSGSDRPTPIGDTRITIEGEGMKDVTTRSSDGRVDFTGGYATGAGLYNGTAKPTVAAYPNPGYEVNYFYGGPTNEPQKYDYAQSSASSFEVSLGGQDHTFHCGFKEKKRNLTVNADSGGSVSPSGTNSYQVENAINITATPNTGYRFSGWTVTEGDATIANTGSSSTTATLHNSNSTITARFEQESVHVKLHMTYGNGGSIVVEDFYITAEKPLPFDVRVTVNQDVIEYDDREDPPIYNTYTTSESVTLYTGSTISNHNKLDSGTSGVDQLGSFWTYIVINGKTYNPFKDTITYTYNGMTYIFE